MFFLDAFLLSISWISSYWFRYLLNKYLGKSINPFHVYLYALPFIISLWLIVSFSFGLYSRKKNVTKFDDFHSLLKSVLLGSLIVMSISFLFKESDFSRLVIFFFIILNFTFMGISRILYRKFEESLALRGYGNVRTLIIGAGTIAVRAMQKLIDYPEVGYEIIGFLDDDPKKAGQKIGKLKVLGSLEEIRSIVKNENIEEVFIAIPTLPHKKILDLIVKCEGYEINFKITTDLFEVITGNASFDVIEDFPIVELKSGFVGTGYEPTRRAFDLLFSTLLIVIFSPLFLIIFLAIKLDSKGPSIFTQERVGKNGRLFKFYKFRTMFANVEKYKISPKTNNDKRITKLGRFLRRTSLDELPQLINIINGDMSIVGPRPEMPFIVNSYTEWQKRRLHVKPGITGLWQILGRKDLPLHENLEYDFFYIKNRSMLLDLTILLKTIPTIIFKKGAY